LNHQENLKQILERLDKIQKNCKVMVAGILAEKEEVAVLTEYRSQLFEATDNLRNRAASMQAISIGEYKKIQDEAKFIKTILTKKIVLIKNFEECLKEEEKKEVLLRNEFHRLLEISKWGNVITLKGKK
jgi:hypothetical protein